MKYKAKIVDINPADPGYFYPTYEYRTATGKVERVEAHNAMVVNPWDLTKEHNIYINEHGEIIENKWLGTVLAFGIIGAFLLLAFLLPESPMLFGLIFVAVGLLPAFIFWKSSRYKGRRRRIMRSLTPIPGKIIWYHEVIRRSKNSTSVYHYPIVEYNYNGHMMQAQLPDSESPTHEGETREFYLDLQHEDIFTENTIKSGGAFSILFTLLFTVPFSIIGIGMMLPENATESLLDWATNVIIKITDAGNATDIGSYTPFVFIAIFMIALAIPAFKELKKLLHILSAKRNGQQITASLVKTNDFGRRSVKVYQYTYMGQPKKYQSTVTTSENVEIYIHPKTEEAYAQKDILVQSVKLGILLFMMVMSICMLLPSFTSIP